MEKIFEITPIAIVLLIVGFVFLIKGADFFVDGSSSIAKKMRIPSIIIGLTIVAMGTSMPELAASVSAALIGNNTLAISNVTGSNIFNLMIVIGVCAVMAFIPVEKSTIKIDFPFSIIAAGILLVLGAVGMKVGRIDGVILTIIFIAYILYMIKSAIDARKNSVVSEEDSVDIEKISVVKCILFILIGAAGIVCGGWLVVESATAIATNIGISQTLIGLTIVAIGTSLPELVTSIVAARKKDVGVAIGNAIGSNIFNVFFILGVAGTISPMTFIGENIIDIIVLIVFSLIVWLMAWKKNGVDKKIGILMIMLYLIYTIYIIVR